jgi:hypothetical protein
MAYLWIIVEANQAPSGGKEFGSPAEFVGD